MKFLSFLRKTHGETSTKTLQSKPDHQTSNGSDFVRRLSGKKLRIKKEDGLEPQQNTDKLEIIRKNLIKLQVSSSKNHRNLHILAHYNHPPPLPTEALGCHVPRFCLKSRTFWMGELMINMV